MDDAEGPAPGRQQSPAKDAGPVDPGPHTRDLDRPRRAPLHLRAWAVVRDMPAVLWRTVVKSWDDSIVGHSAQAAFWTTLSLAPLLLALMGLIGYVANWFGPDTIGVIHDRIISFGLRVFTPNVVDEIIRPMVDGVLQQGRGDVASVGFILALWAGSSALSSYVDSINMAHDQHTVRNPVFQRLFALVLYVEFLVIAVFTLPLVALGPTFLVKYIPTSWHPAVAQLIDFGYLPFVVLMLVGGLALLYRQALPHPLPWYRHLPGAALAALIFLVASTGLRVYLSFIASGRGISYGALATPIAFLLFTFFLGFAVMVGAEFNAALQARWPAREIRTDQLRDWVVEQIKEVGISDPGKAAAEGLRRATDPIRRRQRPEPEPERSAPPRPAPRVGPR
ncbi:YihY/virulence factor BrkB family protein [Tsukamurella spumae]|uniref:YihY/virulence factor BrkB family protein n=1 Tax=Tsukamurella spumae TaxID=44753 RepID=A0A846X167_9ACTN|nr:YihY/virulence factor BrkB family protein [Tsukamurella spumae]NKY18079.1 YihY/virulence factor BrkB family protein [Tsukamurella spumae]